MRLDTILPLHEPGEWSAAFMPLQRSMLQKLRTAKRHECRAPVQGSGAGIFRSGNSLPKGEGREGNRTYCCQSTRLVELSNLRALGPDVDDLPLIREPKRRR